VEDKVSKHKADLVVYLPDTRGTTISRFGKGNYKIGLDVFTYSRLPGHPSRGALGLPDESFPWPGTCPGATAECQAICYAARPVAELGPVYDMWFRNSQTEEVPADLPPGCRYLRLHISGDFTSRQYIHAWTALLRRHPEVTVWAYTRSWRVPELVSALEQLKALPNVQLFASMDKSTVELPPDGWRRAWIEGDSRLVCITEHNQVVKDGNATPSYVCPEETGRKPNCVACGYCLRGRRGDVTFLTH
jgi:hypothetical protein